MHIALVKWFFVSPAAILAGLLAAAGLPGGQADEAPRAAGAATAVAKDAIRYGEATVPIADLFEQYRATREEIDATVRKTDGPRKRIAEITKSLAEIQDEYGHLQQPVERAKAAAEDRRRAAQRALAIPPPPPPRLLVEPSRPGRISSRDGGDYGHSLDDWQRDVERVRQENQRRRDQYDRDLRAYTDMRGEAQKRFNEADAEVKKYADELNDLHQARKEKEKPLLTERQKVSEDVRATGSQTAVLMGRARDMAEALRAAPEGLRLKHGILEWEGVFRSLPDLGNLYAALVGEIARDREQLKVRAETGGAAVPKDWRHPKQAAADALKALIDRKH